ncbi:MAG TPA: hypothetical protein PK156_05600 [Polyangium sp.]|nr:hypothetical protein [Polyangium sp.]
MSNAKVEVEKLLEKLPENASFNDIQYHIYVRQKLERGLTDIEEGRVVDDADEDTQARIDELADKCTEGTLTATERSEYESYVAAIDLVTILQAKARRVHTR